MWIEKLRFCCQQMKTNTLEFHAHCAQKYGKVYRVWFGPLKAAIVCVHPETVKAATLTSDTKGMHSYSLILPWLGKYSTVLH